MTDFAATDFTSLYKWNYFKFPYILSCFTSQKAGLFSLEIKISKLLNSNKTSQHFFFLKSSYEISELTT